MSARVAVIDIGTNTLLLLIAERQSDASGQPIAVALVEECQFGRLGKGLDASGELSAESIATSLEILTHYRKRIDAYGVTHVVAIATQATREARNAAAFTAPAERILATPLAVIAGEREAELAARSVGTALRSHALTRYVVMDVGGGSTEFIIVDHDKIERAVSLPIGAVRLTERFLHPVPPTGVASVAQTVALANFAETQIAALQLPAGLPLIGTAGTATTLAAVHLRLAHYDAEKVTGLALTPPQVHQLTSSLATATIEERIAMPGMVAQRADVIIGGAAIIDAAMLLTGAPQFIVCDRGIRWGMAYEALGLNR